jgi:Xaa-Pro dipeptidase
LIQTFEARWTDRQLESHQFAAAALRRIVDETFSHAHEAVAQGRTLTEYGVQQFILARIREAGMVTSSAPIAAVNAHSADPHYGLTEIGSAEVTREALLLIDLWAKQAVPGSVYADITWTAYVGRTVPVKHQEIFDVVRRGRDAALTFVRSETAVGHRPFGWEVDDACRQIIQQSGYGSAKKFTATAPTSMAWRHRILDV